LKQENKDGDLAQEVQSCGFPRITVDANDVVAVYRVASEAIAHARKGNGPTLIVCKTYRLNEHSTAGSRKQAATLQMESPEDHDPILNMEKYLAGKGLFRKQLKASIAADFCEDLYGAFELVTKSQAAETSP
jgi:pyruvate dehydrogenase E1 component alpha subunit